MNVKFNKKILTIIFAVNILTPHLLAKTPYKVTSYAPAKTINKNSKKPSQKIIKIESDKDIKRVLEIMRKSDIKHYKFLMKLQDSNFDLFLEKVEKWINENNRHNIETKKANLYNTLDLTKKELNKLIKELAGKTEEAEKEKIEDEIKTKIKIVVVTRIKIQEFKVSTAKKDLAREETKLHNLKKKKSKLIEKELSKYLPNY